MGPIVRFFDHMLRVILGLPQSRQCAYFNLHPLRFTVWRQSSLDFDKYLNVPHSPSWYPIESVHCPQNPVFPLFHLLFFLIPGNC